MNLKNTRNLKLPLAEKIAEGLKLGDIINVSGTIFTGRSRFHIRAIEEKIVPPLDYSKINSFLHAGPVMKKTSNGWKVVSIEPTSSIRFERYGGDVIKKLHLRVVMGKTTMDRKAAAALRETGGVYLSKIGLCGNMLAGQVKIVSGVYFLEELGKTEATWVLEVDNFGPFFVAIDSSGRSYFEDLDCEVKKNLKSARKQLGISEDYKLTSVNV